MKILIVVPALGDVYGGPSKSVVELAEAIGQSESCQVDLITTNANGSKFLDVPLFTWIDKNKYRVQFFPRWYSSEYKFSWSLTFWLFQNVRNYDIVHTNAIFSYPVLPAYWACQIHEIPYITTPRGMLEPWALSYKSDKKKLYFTLLEKPALQKAAAIHMLALSEAEGARCLSLKPPLVVVPNGVHKKDFDSLPSPEILYEQFPDTRNKTLIIFLGRIDPKKGLDLLATAFANVHKLFPEVHLIVAGQDNIGFLASVQEYFIETGCSEAVTFTGMLTGELKYAALAAANIYVAPSYSEGFSMSVLEGMAAGLPCVITKGCNFPEASDVSYIVDIDAEQIAWALTSLLQDPIKAKKMGDRARQFILEEYTWDKIASRMIAIYSKFGKRQFATHILND